MIRRDSFRRWTILLIYFCALSPLALAQEAERSDHRRHFAGPRAHGFSSHEEFRARRGRGHAMRGPGDFQRRRGGPGRGGAQLLRLLQSPRIQRELGLTEEQQEKLQEIGFTATKVSIQQQADLRVERLELGRLMHAESPDRAAIENKLDRIGQAQMGLARVMVNAFLDGHSVLTAEQRGKIKGLLRHRGRHRRSGEPPSPPSPPQ